MTPGLVTVMKDGEVRLKIVAGSEGSNAPAVAIAIKALGKVPTIDRAWSIAKQFKFGTCDDRVVMSKQAVRHSKRHGIPPESFHTTFTQADVNPCWKPNTACCTVVIDL